MSPSLDRKPYKSRRATSGALNRRCISFFFLLMTSIQSHHPGLGMPVMWITFVMPSTSITILPLWKIIPTSSYLLFPFSVILTYSVRPGVPFLVILLHLLRSLPPNQPSEVGEEPNRENQPSPIPHETGDNRDSCRKAKLSSHHRISIAHPCVHYK